MQIDVILAADVVWLMELVEPLVNAIQIAPRLIIIIVIVTYFLFYMRILPTLVFCATGIIPPRGKTTLVEFLLIGGLPKMRKQKELQHRKVAEDNV